VTAAVDELADWSAWAQFADAVAMAPRLPGVYLLRLPSQQIVYVGRAGERAGSGRPMGLQGRLSVYRSGKGAVSGFGEAAFNQALADPGWIEGQLVALRADGPKRAKTWAKEAIERLSPEVRWAITADGRAARLLESDVVALLAPHGLWNR
jgi:hypothetical protein